MTNEQLVKKVERIDRRLAHLEKRNHAILTHRHGHITEARQREMLKKTGGKLKHILPKGKNSLVALQRKMRSEWS